LAMTRSQQRVDLCAILSPDWWQRGKLAHLIPNLNPSEKKSYNKSILRVGTATSQLSHARCAILV
jgi:hypothetical protein